MSIEAKKSNNSDLRTRKFFPLAVDLSRDLYEID